MKLNAKEIPSFRRLWLCFCVTLNQKPSRSQLRQLPPLYAAFLHLSGLNPVNKIVAWAVPSHFLSPLWLSYSRSIGSSLFASILLRILIKCELTERGRKSPKLSGSGFLGMNTVLETFHWDGICPVQRIVLKMMASSSALWVLFLRSFKDTPSGPGELLLILLAVWITSDLVTHLAQSSSVVWET